MKQKTAILKLKEDDHEREIEFELDYLLSLSIDQRFNLMFEKSRLIKQLLKKNGHGKPDKIIKQKEKTK